MNKRSVLVSLFLLFSITLFAADVDKYMADLDPAKDEKTIIAAANWMRTNSEKTAIPKLVSLLGDSRDMVRLYAVMALGYLGDEDIIDSVNNVILNDSNPSVRYTALLTSMRIGSKKSIPVWEEAKKKETDPAMKDLLGQIEKKAKGK